MVVYKNIVITFLKGKERGAIALKDCESETEDAKGKILCLVCRSGCWWPYWWQYGVCLVKIRKVSLRWEGSRARREIRNTYEYNGSRGTSDFNAQRIGNKSLEFPKSRIRKHIVNHRVKLQYVSTITYALRCKYSLISTIWICPSSSYTSAWFHSWNMTCDMRMEHIARHAMYRHMKHRTRKFQRIELLPLIRCALYWYDDEVEPFRNDLLLTFALLRQRGPDRQEQPSGKKDQLFFVATPLLTFSDWVPIPLLSSFSSETPRWRAENNRQCVRWHCGRFCQDELVSL